MPPLLDTHQHLIYPDRLGYGWAAATPALAGRAFTVEDYRAMTRGAGVAGTIFMEAAVDDGDYRKEVRLIAERMRRPGSGILGIIASIRPETDAGFDAWVEEGRALGVVGYRRILHEIPTTCRGPRPSAPTSASSAAAGCRSTCASRPPAADRAGAGPRLPGHRRSSSTTAATRTSPPGLRTAGRSGLSALAAMPNVVAKLSGVYAKSPPAPRRWHGPPLRRARDRGLRARPLPLGQRLAGGEHPRRSAAWIAAFRAILAGFSPAEQAAMAHGTAERVYGVRLPAAGEA